MVGRNRDHQMILDQSDLSTDNSQLLIFSFSANPSVEQYCKQCYMWKLRTSEKIISFSYTFNVDRQKN